MVKVLFAHQTHPIEPLGIGYISSSIARGGHESQLELTSKNINEAVEHISEAINREEPDLFCQSIIFGSHGYAIELNKRVKERYPSLVSVLGGPAGTFTPELIDRGFDVLCRYEGEDPFLEFCNAFANREDVGNIPNIWVNENPVLYRTEVKKIKKILDIDNPGYRYDSGYDTQRRRFINDTRKLLEGGDLDSIPTPDRALLYKHRIYRESPIIHFMHTRGCAFHCTYCHVEMQNIENRGKGRVVRRRANELFAAEVNEVRKLLGRDFLVYFQDDILGFGYKRELAEEFRDVYKSEVGLPFHGHVRFDLISKDEGIARALADAGCTGVHVAIESGDADIRNRVHGRGMSETQILRGAEYLRKYGIKMMTQNIFGAPGETKEQMLKTFELNKTVCPTFASVSIFQPYPGTSSLEYAKQTGTLPVREINALIDIFGMESFYDKSILATDPEHKRWMEVAQKFFAIAIDRGLSIEEYEDMIEPYLKDNGRDGGDDELKRMYRAHRTEKDDILYGVKLRDVVDA